VGDVAGAGGEHVVITGGGDVGDHHPVLHALLQVDVLVQGNVRPVVDQLDLAVGRSDAVDAAEPLDDAYRVPVDVVVDEIVAVLEVLALGDAVRCNQDVQLGRLVGYDQVLLLRARR